MVNDKVLEELKELNTEIKEIKKMLSIIVGDKVIGRSNSPGLIDKIIDCLEKIERN